MQTIADIRKESPFPWRTEVNFDGAGGVRMLDANNAVVPLFSITALSQYASVKIASVPSPVPA